MNVFFTLDCAQPGCNKRTNLSVCSACNATRCYIKVCKVADCAVHCDKCKELKEAKRAAQEFIPRQTAMKMNRP
jgi:hypothetical protein